MMSASQVCHEPQHPSARPLTGSLQVKPSAYSQGSHSTESARLSLDILPQAQTSHTNEDS
ncbi:MAG: hypothetical protein LZF86_220009 [Nitrospira sp.]|nr:MAG: hypothetical protein LZF86_220009 [Nitrospira sp.]